MPKQRIVVYVDGSYASGKGGWSFLYYYKKAYVNIGSFMATALLKTIFRWKFWLALSF